MNILVTNTYSGDGGAWYDKYVGTVFNDVTAETLSDGVTSKNLYIIPNEQIPDAKPQVTLYWILQTDAMVVP